jgi:hypothetical protein
MLTTSVQRGGNTTPHHYSKAIPPGQYTSATRQHNQPAPNRSATHVVQPGCLGQHVDRPHAHTTALQRKRRQHYQTNVPTKCQQPPPALCSPPAGRHVQNRRSLHTRQFCRGCRIPSKTAAPFILLPHARMKHLRPALKMYKGVMLQDPPPDLLRPENEYDAHHKTRSLSTAPGDGVQLSNRAS